MSYPDHIRKQIHLVPQMGEGFFVTIVMFRVSVFVSSPSSSSLLSKIAESCILPPAASQLAATSRCQPHAAEVTAHVGKTKTPSSGFADLVVRLIIVWSLAGIDSFQACQAKNALLYTHLLCIIPPSLQGLGWMQPLG